MPNPVSWAARRASLLSGKTGYVTLTVFLVIAIAALLGAPANLSVVSAQTPTVDYDSDDDRLLEISDLAQLNAVRWDRNGDGTPSTGDETTYAAAFPTPATGMGCPSDGCNGYELAADLDFDTNGSGAADAGDAYWNSGAGWDPIDDFAARFVGDDYPISNLFIETTGNVGLFGTITSSGKVRNLGLVGVNIAISGSGGKVGGIVGLNEGRIIASYATGAISVGGDNNNTGGLAGHNFGPIIASYSTVNITGKGGIRGGLVGINNDANAKIIASYSTGSIDAIGIRGGMVGANTGSATNSYWDTDTSGHTTSQVGTGKTTAELQTPTDYTGIYADWDNIDINGDGVDDAEDTNDFWDFGSATEYPALSWETAVVVEPSVTVDYDSDDDRLLEISDLAQLDAVRWDRNGDGTPAADNATDYAAAFPNPATGMGCPSNGCNGYELTADLDFDTDDDGDVDSSDDYWNGGSGWDPIDGYNAIFEGDGHTISNLFISRDADLGLFGEINGNARVRNLGLVDVNITVSGASSNVGGIAGENNDGWIIASYSTGAISLGGGNNNDTGGLVGDNTGRIVASYSTVNITNTGGIRGGLVGYNNRGKIIASYSTGAISSGGSPSGGLVGYQGNGGTATNSYWDTETSGRSSSGAGTGKTTAELQSPTDYTGIYAAWDDIDVDGDGTADTNAFWDFGAASEYPITVTITLTDVDEAGSVSFSSDDPRVGAALTATLTDPDGGVTGETWVWASSATSGGTFTAISGATSASYTPVADDVGDYLRATASYTDNHGSGKTASAVTDNAVGGNSSAGLQRRNRQPLGGGEHCPGQSIGAPITATDPDGDTLTYSLGETDVNDFGIDSASGQLQTKAALNYETKSSYEVMVEVSDLLDSMGNVDDTIDRHDHGDCTHHRCERKAWYAGRADSGGGFGVGHQPSCEME